VSSHSDSITTPELLQRLRDNENSYSIQAVGIIQDTHRFTALPDFQVHTGNIPVMRELRDHAMELSYDKLKAFNMNFNAEVNVATAFPGPPSFLRSAGQTEDFESRELRRQKPKPPKPQPTASRRESAYAGKPFNEQSISLETDDIPQAPSEGLPKQMGGLVKPAIDALGEVFKVRPIVSVRAFDCLQPGHTRNSLRAAIPHVGYYMNSGPWAHCIAKYGVDPRKDPAMRKYQTIQISCKGTSTASIPEGRRNDRSKAHIFDGSRIAIVSGIWQLCDLTDSTLQHIIRTDDVRTECELEQWGWYHPGTIAKIRVLLRDKMLRLVNDAAALPEEDYMALAGLPNVIKETVGFGASVYANNSDLQAMCSAIAKDAVYRDREASAADKKSTAPGDVGREASERVESGEYHQDGDADYEDYVED
jgi:general transcription factor 3C polypeptide 5 (transcription factor C subunit 1)